MYLLAILSSLAIGREINNATVSSLCYVLCLYSTYTIILHTRNTQLQSTCNVLLVKLNISMSYIVCAIISIKIIQYVHI